MNHPKRQRRALVVTHCFREFNPHSPWTLDLAPIADHHGWGKSVPEEAVRLIVARKQRGQVVGRGQDKLWPWRTYRLLPCRPHLYQLPQMPSFVNPSGLNLFTGSDPLWSNWLWSFLTDTPRCVTYQYPRCIEVQLEWWIDHSCNWKWYST